MSRAADLPETVDEAPAAVRFSVTHSLGEGGHNALNVYPLPESQPAAHALRQERLGLAAAELAAVRDTFFSQTEEGLAVRKAEAAVEEAKRQKAEALSRADDCGKKWDQAARAGRDGEAKDRDRERRGNLVTAEELSGRVRVLEEELAKAKAQARPLLAAELRAVVTRQTAGAKDRAEAAMRALAEAVNPVFLTWLLASLELGGWNSAANRLDRLAAIA